MQGGRFGLALVLICMASLSDAQDFFTLKGHGGPIKGVAAGPDGVILTASFDNSVGVWRDGVPQWLEGHDAAVNAVVATQDGQVVSAGDDWTVRLWQPSGTDQVLARHAGKVIRLALSPDQTRVASASWDGTAQIVDLSGQSAPVLLKGHSSNVNDIVFTRDGARVLTASTDGTIRVWDAQTGEPIRQLVSYGFGVNALVLGPDETWVAFGAVDGGTRIVDMESGAVLGDFTLDRRPILALALDPTGQFIAVGDAEGYIMLVDAHTRAIAKDFRATLSGPIWALAYAPDGQNIYAGGLDTAMYSWPVANFGDAPVMADTNASFLTPPEEMSNGERQFQRKCSICHALGPDGGRRAGPTLYGLFGRPAGNIDGYLYSDTLERAQVVWDETSIDMLFDLGPDHYIPGSKMPMQRITNATDRADLVAFLRKATTD